MDEVGQLLAACEEGIVETVESLIDQGMCVDSMDESEITPLQVAAANGHEQLVRQLLMRGAALDKPNAMGWTPLLHAARYGHIHVTSRLLQNQADINARTKLGANAIMLAARGGHLPTCKCLVEAGIDLSPSTGVGSTACEFIPVMAAAHYGHDTVVRYLLDRGFDVNSRTPSMGVSALMLTALNGHMTTAQVLIERGADPNFTNVNAQTALDIATARGHREVRGYLDRKTSNKPHHATEDVKPDIIEAVKQETSTASHSLLQQTEEEYSERTLSFLRGDMVRINEILRDDVTQRDACSPEDGATPLMFSAMSGRLDVCQLLLKSECDINKQDTVSGWTALMQAIYHGKKAVAKCLISAGADVLIPAKNGCTAFDMASLIDDVDTELYRLMAAKAVQINRAEKKSKTWSNDSRQSGSISTMNDPEHQNEAGNVEQQQKNGLKAWWSRMSNRFRNLKLGRTFNFSTNRLAPLPVEGSGGNGTNNTILKRSPALSNRLTSTGKRGTKVDVAEMTSAISTITSYDTMLLDTQESATVYSLGINSVSASIQDSTIKPVIPPFLPPPTFETDRPRMPPVSSRRSIASFGSTSTLTSARPIVPPVKLLQSYSTLNLASSPASPSASLRLQHSNNASPSSSGGASGVSVFTRSRSSATSSTLTAGSDRKLGSLRDSSSSTPQPQLPPINGSNFLAMHPSYHRFTQSPSSHTRSRGGSSKDTSSTLTPMTAHTPRSAYTSHGNRVSPQPTITVADDDDLNSILKVLSLERYQPIFEEQEVDMEAFLTLTENDLQEIGISQETSRNQILSAISELNSGKGRERQNYQEYMSQFDTMYLRNAGSDTADCWSMQEDETRPTDTSKSCVS